MAVGKASMTLIDKQAKGTNVGFYTVEFSAVNFTALNGMIDTAFTAIEAVTTLPTIKDERLASVERFSYSLPTAAYAVKGLRWLVRGIDVNGNAVTIQIPGADLSLSANGRDLDLTTGVGQDLANALNAVWMSNDGEAVTVVEVVYLDK